MTTLNICVGTAVPTMIDGTAAKVKNEDLLLITFHLKLRSTVSETPIGHIGIYFQCFLL